MSFSSGFWKLAGGYTEALNTLGDIARQSKPVKGLEQQFQATGQKYLQKAQNINLWSSGSKGAASGASGAMSGATKAGGPSANLSLQGGNRLRLDYGNLQANLHQGGGLDAKYRIPNSNFTAQASASGGDRRVGLMYQKEF